MKLGCPTHPRRDVLADIDWIAQHDFDFVDLFLEPDQGAAEAVDPVKIRSALEGHRLEAVGHLAYYLPTGSPMRQLRDAAVSCAADYLAVFAEIGVSLVTVHAHWPPGMFTTEEGLAWQEESLHSLLARSRAFGIRLMYEPIGTRHDTPEVLDRLLRDLPDLLCHLDIGHCNLWGRQPAAMIRQVRDRLMHLHVHDNDAISDLHLPPGTGTVDWPAVFAALAEIGYKRTLTLEVFSPERDYLLLAKRKVEQWMAQASV